MNIKMTEMRLPDCFELRFSPHIDDRGTFLKTFQRDSFKGKGLETEFVETFSTVSGENVLRGMHVQLPPADHAKLTYCLVGRVQDVLLDLRKGSPAFGQHQVLELAADCFNAVYVPRGVAHGFLVMQAPAIMLYHVTSTHVPSLDAGIAWDSFGAPWLEPAPRVSKRDAALPRLSDFKTPFRYSPDRMTYGQ
jgi:dTDP-4-dehydrorhamnose 3,5-epimerase